MAKKRRSKPQKGPVGRPPGPVALTPAFEKKFLAMLRDGVFPEPAARACGITGTTYYSWMKAGKEEESGQLRDFREKVLSARASAQVMYVQALAKSAKKGNLQAAMFYLERTDPVHWGRQDKLKVENTIRQDDLLQLMRQMAGVIQDNVQDPTTLLRIRAGFLAVLAQLYPEAVAAAAGQIDRPQLPAGETPPPDETEQLEASA